MHALFINTSAASAVLEQVNKTAKDHGLRGTAFIVPHFYRRACKGFKVRWTSFTGKGFFITEEMLA